jgi:hypothetical protein
VPAGGVAIVVVAVPDGCVPTINELLEATPEEHAYAIESVEPTSAMCGEHESDAAGAPLEFGVQSHPAMHAPLIDAVQVPTVQPEAGGRAG